MDLVRPIVFVLASAGLAILSRQSFRNRHSHGFPRFFAFEAILILILLNAPHWFRDPFSPTQLISWTLLLTSALMALHGFYLLQVIGKPEGNFENTTTLVVRGAYRYIRHPLYSSLLGAAWGIYFKDISISNSVLVALASAALVATAKTEEKENVEKFGEEYTKYIRQTTMFIPYVL